MLVNTAAAEAVDRSAKLEVTISELKADIEKEKNKVVDAEMKTVQAERARDMHRDALLAHKDELAAEKRKRLELTRAHRALIAEEEDHNRTIASLTSKLKDTEDRLDREKDMVTRLQEERQEAEQTLQKSSKEWCVYVCGVPARELVNNRVSPQVRRETETARKGTERTFRNHSRSG